MVSSGVEAIYIRSKLQNRQGAPKEIRRLAKKAGQTHVLRHWPELDEEEKAQLAEKLDLLGISKIFKTSTEVCNQAAIRPVPDGQVFCLKLEPDGFVKEDSELRLPCLDAGLHLISAGKLGVICLAGGQGTRLGSTDPKGMFDIGLPSKKSLFELHANRIWRIQAMAAHYVHKDQTLILHSIPFIIMTSPATDAKTRQFFQEHNNFLLRPDQIHFIVQDELPCLSEDGKIIMASKSAMARAPNGNGGLYTALIKSGVLDLLEERGVQYFDVFCVDNALARVADPHLAGHTHLKDADVGAKVVAKAYPTERVGVFAMRGEAMEVVEYSELDPEQASSVDPATGRLKYNWANISSFCFTTSFIRRAAEELENSGRYHIARKQIPSIDGAIQGIKLESFIFDPLHRADKIVLMEAERSSHFAPVKNANGATNDTPEAARAAVLALHRRWVEASGGTVRLPEGKDGPEISHRRCYQGEGIHYMCQGRVFTDSWDDFLQGVIENRYEIERLLALQREQEDPPSKLPAQSSMRRLSSLLRRSFSGSQN